jgi:drug/metabolite transporter (DMT)-like permease
MSNANRVKTEFMLFLVVIIWGANYTVGKFGVAQLSPQWFTLLRFLIATPLMLLLTRWREKAWVIPRKYWGRLIASGLIGISLYQTMFMLSVKYSTATDAALLISLSPIFTAILGPIFGQERLNLKGFIGAAIAFIGAAMVILLGASSNKITSHAMLGAVAGFIAAILWGVYPLVASPLVKVYSSLRVTAWSGVVGVLGLILMIWWFPTPVTFQLSLSAWLSILYAALPVTVFGLVAWYDGISKMGSHSVMVYMFSIPVAAMVTAYFAIHESIHLGQIIGAVIIFVGTVLLRSQSSHTATKAGRNPSTKSDST